MLKLNDLIADQFPSNLDFTLPDCKFCIHSCNISHSSYRYLNGTMQSLIQNLQL